MLNLWLTIGGMVLVTYSVRLLFIAWLGDGGLPDNIKRALRYVPPAVLSAIIFPSLLVMDGSVNLSPGNLRLIAGLVAAIIAWWRGSILLSIAVGMVLLWVLQAIVPLG